MCEPFFATQKSTSKKVAPEPGMMDFLGDVAPSDVGTSAQQMWGANVGNPLIARDLPPSQDVRHHPDFCILRFGCPNLNLHFPLASWVGSYLEDHPS